MGLLGGDPTEMYSPRPVRCRRPLGFENQVVGRALPRYTQKLRMLDAISTCTGRTNRGLV